MSLVGISDSTRISSFHASLKSLGLLGLSSLALSRGIDAIETNLQFLEQVLRMLGHYNALYCVYLDEPVQLENPVC